MSELNTLPKPIEIEVIDTQKFNIFIDTTDFPNFGG